ncbi:Sterol 3-beta-glucosyltransferase UGT80A2 [Linum grandiflorum]
MPAANYTGGDNVDASGASSGGGIVNTGASGDLEPLDAVEFQNVPPLQIVMLIAGTRGDVQPFVAIGIRLKDYGHRVRLATHSIFKEFVLTAGLEFYPLGGDPKVLAGYMVTNKGLFPSNPSEISVHRNQMKEIIWSLLPACTKPDIDSGIPFKAEAIIANPPTFGHTDVAEALKIPIHVFFTLPWTSTREFPHPFSRIKQAVLNRLSYQIVDSLIWLGIGDIINDVRKRELKLHPVTFCTGLLSSNSDVPHGYLWSPDLVPKPTDWGPNVEVVGFCFLDLASNFELPQELVKWLEAGPKPIYIGFGSCVHHGGAGTTAAGLKAGCPTTVVPFVADQPFWGDRVYARGVGPAPIPVEEFSLLKLVDAIKFMLDPQVKERAVELAKAMENEDGVAGAVTAFFKQLVKNNNKTEADRVSEPSSVSLFSRCFGFS